MPIDRKYRIQAVNPCKVNAIYTEEDGIFFKAKDVAVPYMIQAYIARCKELECGIAHIKAMELVLERIKEYQKEIGSKVPDTNLSCEIVRCVDGILDPG